MNGRAAAKEPIGTARHMRLFWICVYLYRVPLVALLCQDSYWARPHYAARRGVVHSSSASPLRPVLWVLLAVLRTRVAVRSSAGTSTCFTVYRPLHRVAYVYLIAAVWHPDLSPSFRTPEGGEVPGLFEPAAVLVTLVLPRQVLNCRPTKPQRHPPALLYLAHKRARRPRRRLGADVALYDVVSGNRLRRPSWEKFRSTVSCSKASAVDEIMITGDRCQSRNACDKSTAARSTDRTFVMRAGACRRRILSCAERPHGRRGAAVARAYPGPGRYRFRLVLPRVLVAACYFLSRVPSMSLLRDYLRARQRGCGAIIAFSLCARLATARSIMVGHRSLARAAFLVRIRALRADGEGRHMSPHHTGLDQGKPRWVCPCAPRVGTAWGALWSDLRGGPPASNVARASLWRERSQRAPRTAASRSARPSTSPRSRKAVVRGRRGQSRLRSAYPALLASSHRSRGLTAGGREAPQGGSRA